MNKFKFLNVIISCSIAIPAYAQEIPVAADKATVSQLIRDNKALTESIANQKMALEHEAHMFSNPGQYGRLTQVLDAYQNFIDQKGDLPEDKRRALDQIVDASAEVGHIRERGAGGSGTVGPVSDAEIQQALDQNQQLLDNQAALLDQKNKQLNDFQNQLAKIKNQLAANNQRHAAQAAIPQEPKTIIKEVPKTIIKEVPVKEVVYKDNPALAKALAQKSKELEDSRRNLAAFKDQLARNNRRYQDAVKVSKATALNDNLDQAGKQKLQEENKKLQDNLNALKEENIRNIRQAQEAAKEAAVAKALAQRNLIDDKAKQLQNYKEELKDLKGKLAETSKRLDETNKAASQKAKDDALDQAQAERLQNAMNQKAAQVDALLDQNKKLVNVVEKLKNEVIKKQDLPTPEELKKIMAEKEGLLKSKDDLLAEKSSQLQQLKDELSRIKNDLNKTNDRYEAAIKEYQDKTKSSDLDAVESARLARDLANKAAQVSDLTAKNQELANTLNALNVNKDKLSDVEKLLAQKDADIASLKNELAHLLEQNTLMHKQLDQEDIDLHQIRDKAELFRQKYLEQLGLVEAKDKDIKQLNEQLAKMPKTEDFNAQLNALKDQIAKAQQQSENLRTDLANTEKELAANKQALVSKDQHLSDLEAKVAQIPTTTVNKSEADALAKQLAASQEQIAALQAQLKKDDEVFAHLKDKGLELKDKIASLNNAVAFKDSQIEDLKLSIKQANADKTAQTPEALKQQIETMAKATLTPQEQAQFDNLKKQYEIVVQNPLKNGKDIDPQAEELKRHYEIVVKSPQEIADMIKENRVAAEPSQELAELKDEAKSLRDQLLKLKEESKQVVVKEVPAPVSVVSNNSKVDALEAKLQLAEQEAQGLKDQIAELKNLQSSTVDKSAFDELKKQYELALKMPAKEVIKVVPGPERVVEKTVEVKADTKELEAKLSFAQNEAKNLKDQIAALQATKDKESAEAQARFNDLKTQLGMSQDQFNILRSEILKNREVITAKQDQSYALQTAMKEQLGTLADKTALIKQKDERLALQQMLQAKQRAHIDLLVRKNQLVVEYQNRLVEKLSTYQQKFEGATSDWDAHKQQYAAKLAEFKASIETMNRNNEELNKQIEAKNQEKEDAYKIVDRFKDRLKETADVTENQSKELAKYRQRSDELENRFRKLHDEMVSKEDAYEQTQEKFGKLKAEHDEALKEVQVKDLSLSMAQSNMQAKTKMLQTLVEQLKNQVNLSNAQLDTMRKELKEAEGKVEKANRHEDLDRLKEMLKSSREEIIQINTLLKSKEQQIDKLQKDLQDNSIDFTSQHKAINALKVDMEKQQVSITKLDQDIDWKNKEIARLKAQLKAKKIDLLPASLNGVELVIAKDRKQIAELTAQLEAAKGKIKTASIPMASDPQGLRRALNDAQEQIATLKSKLNQKLQGLVKNDPIVMKMNQEIQSLNDSLVDVMKENANLKDKNEALFNQMQNMQGDLSKCQDQIQALPKSSKK